MTKRTKFTTPTERREFMQLSASRTRLAVREQEARQTRQALEAWMHRWRADRESVLAEHRWTCPECGAVVEPFVIDGLHGRPVVGARERCECGGMRVEEESA